MSSAQTDILAAIDARIAVVLPGYSRLKYSYNLEANDYRGCKGAFGSGAGSGSSVDGTHKSITMDQEFFVVLTETYGGRQNDVAERSALTTIYDNTEALYLDFFQSKIGIPSVVYLVSELQLDDPEIISDNVISVRMSFTVKHRKQTT